MWIKPVKTQSLISFVLVAVLLIVVALASLSLYLNKKRKETFLKSNIEQIEKSVRVAISFETDRLKQITFDYTFWDEMVGFIYIPKPDWAKDNLDPIITTYKTDLLCVLDTNFRKVYSVNREEYNFLQDLKLSDSTLKQIISQRFIQFYYKTNYGIAEVHAATIHTTSDQTRVGSVYGIMIIGNVIDSTYLKNVSLVTGTRIWQDSIPIESRMLESKQGITLSIPLFGQDNSVIGYYNVEKVYDFFKHYTNFSLQLLSILIFSILLIVLTLIIVFSYWVNRPLKIVEQILYNDNTSRIAELQSFGSEFGEIGNLIDHTIEQKKTLEILKDKAEESDRLKSAFLANMSHEIRTPLNAISGFAELLCQSSPNDEESKSYKKIIMNSSSDLLHLINDILDYSKIEAGQLVLKNEPFSINDLFDELYAIYSKKNLNKSVRVICLHPDKNFNINSDRQRIKQVMVNLLDNALKFTEKGVVEFGFKLVGSEFEMWVKDTGVGVPESSRELIFERFHQVNKNPTKLYGGTGLGLSICKGLVALLGGTIKYSSNTVGGSIFTVVIPQLPVEAESNHQEVENNSTIPQWSGKRVLVVEDDELSLKLIIQYLKRTGVEISSFNEASSAIDFVRKNKIDIVLMDIRILGDIDGFEATRVIKSFKPNLPIIAQTAFALDKDRDKAIENGCDEYISKPYSSDTLTQIIAKFI